MKNVRFFITDFIIRLFLYRISFFNSPFKFLKTGK
jgi:hypothetical protein